MAEFCLDCLNKIMGTNDPPQKYIISKRPDLCENCGEMKPVVIRLKHYPLSTRFRNIIFYLRHY